MSSAQCKQSVQVLLSVCSKKDRVVMSILSATREAEAGRMELVDSKSDLARLCLQNKKKKMMRDGTRWLECLPRTHESLGLIPRPTTNSNRNYHISYQ